MERLPQGQDADNNLERSNAVGDRDLVGDPFHSSNPSHQDPASSHRLLSSNEGAKTSSFLKGDRGSTNSSESRLLENRTLAERFGWIGITILFAGTAVILAALGFLGFLYLADYRNKTWQLIIIRGWATRAVSLSALAIRTAISFQSGLATAMLAALVLERFGVLLEDSAQISTLRSSTPHPFNLAYPLVLGLSKNKSKIAIPLIVTVLVFTTILLQFTSTVLLADLTLGPVPSLSRDSTIAYNFASVYTNTTDRGSGMNPHYITRPSTWTRKPPFYPVFAEYSEGPFMQEGVKDTGLTLRAFLPLQSAQARENLRNYTGRATVLDSRVTCQRPAMVNESVYYSGSVIYFAGQVSASTPTPRLDNSTVQTDRMSFGRLENEGVRFGCAASVADPVTLNSSNFSSWQTSICQLPQGRIQEGITIAIAGGLVSEFVKFRENKTTEASHNYNAAYLVLNVTSGASHQWEKVMFRPKGPPDSRPPFYSEHDEWVDYVWSNRELVLSATLCYASYDSADVDVRISSNRNRTEPTTGYNITSASYTFADIRRQLGQTEPGTSLDDRGVLALEKRSSWLSDFQLNHTDRQQSWLQNDGDMMGQNSSVLRLNSGMNGNVSAALWGGTAAKSLIPLQRSPPMGIAWTITADGMYSSLFQEIIAAGGSVAFAIQSLITVFSGLAYYDQLPQFDLRRDSEQISFVYMITPQSHRGFSAVVVVLVIHLFTIICVAVWFALASRYTLLGNSWLSVAQVVSSETDDTIARATTATDKIVTRLLKDEDRKGQTIGIGHVGQDGRVAILRRVNKF